MARSYPPRVGEPLALDTTFRGRRLGSDSASRRERTPPREIEPMTTERVTLRDGTAVLIRPVEAADAHLLTEAFGRLSDTSRASRFLTGKPRLTDREVRDFSDVDHHDHEAIGALDPRDGRGIGIARYIRLTDDRNAAEFAITVIDAWHGRGVGGELTRRLICRAREEGIERFTAVVALHNRAVLPLLQSSGQRVRVIGHDRYTLEYELSLGKRALPAGTAP